VVRSSKEQPGSTATPGKPFYLQIIKTIAHRGWLLAPILALQLIPPYSSQGYSLLEWPAVNSYILTHPVKHSFAALYPIFQATPLALVALVLLAGNRVRRIFSVYAALSYVAIAFLQSISISDRYGLGICVANLLTFLILAGMWFWETMFPKNHFSAPKQPAWKYWAVVLALAPFWEPVNPKTLLPDFNPVYILTSGAGLSFCLVTPLYLAILTLYFPDVNRSILTFTGFVGIIMSLGNMALEFVIYPVYWWIGVLHIPLFIISSYSLWLSFSNGE
jgi:hypothetical protein